MPGVVRFRALWVGIVVLMLSGCLGVGPEAGESTPAPSQGPDPFPPRSWTMRLEACRGFDAVFEAPRSAVRQEVPEGLNPFGSTPSTASIFFRALRCDRASNDTRVYENVSLGQFFVRVTPENRSWATPDSLNMYGLDSFASPPVFADGLRLLRVVPLESSTFDGGPLAGATGASVQRWKFTGRNTTLQFEFEATGQRAGGYAGTDFDWHGSTDLSRVDRFMDYRRDYALQQAGTFQISGPSRIGGVMGSSVIPYKGQSIAHDEEVWQANETVYRS